MKAIEFKEVSKAFDVSFKKKANVLNQLSFSVEKASVTGFLGANGSGKTTSFKALLGLIFADSGEIQVSGKEVSTETKSKIGFMPERPSFPEHLDAYEFLTYAKNLISGDFYPIDTLLERVGLADVGRKRISTFSKGMLQRLAFAQSILHKPEVIILDEPMSGLDPKGREEMMSLIMSLAKEGKTVFLSSHLVGDLERVCSHLVAIDKGACVYNGSIEALFADAPDEIEIQLRNDQGLESHSFSDNKAAKAFLQNTLSKGEELVSYNHKRDLYSALRSLGEHHE